MRNSERLSPREKLIRHSVEHPPWLLPRGDSHSETNRGTWAAFKRWTAADQEPSVEMLAAVWKSPFFSSFGLDGHALDEAVRRATLILHVYALMSPDGPMLDNIGTACSYRAGGTSKAIVSEARFARIVNTPPPWIHRLEALARLARRFRAAGIRVKHGDAVQMHRFVFGDNTKRVIARWANSYYHVEKQEDEKNGIGTDSDQ